MTVGNRSNVIRVPIETAIAQKAADKCAAHGLNLVDFLRGVITRVAVEGIGKDPRRPLSSTTSSTTLPFNRFGQYLLDDLRHVRAEVVLLLLTKFVANRARLLAMEQARSQPDRKKINAWKQEVDEALLHRRTLDPKNTRVLTQLERRLLPLVNADLNAT